MTTFNFQIISPQGIKYNDYPSMVLLPGESGQFAVLSGHENYIAKLKVGVIAIYKDENIVDKFVVKDGFIEFKDNICIALIDDVVNKKQVDFKSIELKLNLALSEHNADEIEMSYLKEILKLNTL